MENTPRNTDEEARAAAAKAEALDDDDDEEEVKTPPRHAPGVTVEKVKAEEGNKSRPRFADRLLESLGAKPEKDQATATEAKEPKFPEKSGPSKEASEPNEPMEVTEASLVDDSGKLIDDEVDFKPDLKLPPASSEKPQDSKAKPESNTPIDAADWSAEDEVSPNAETPVHTESGVVDIDPDEEDKEFAEIPPAPEVEDEAPGEETAPVDPELLEDGLGSEGPPEPPEDIPPMPPEEPPEPSRDSSSYSGGGGGGGYSGRPWYDAAAADRARVAAKELEDAEYKGRVAGTRRGLGAGLLFGWLIGRHGKKKQAKAHLKELKSKNKEIDSLKTEQMATAQRLEAVQRTQEQLRADMQQKDVKPPQGAEKVPAKLSEATSPNMISSVEKQVDTKPSHAVEASSPTVINTYESPGRAEKMPKPLEVSVAAAALASVERAVSGTSAERLEKAKSSESQKKEPENQEITEETYQTSEGRRVETSAWHRIEIDEKTGKAVEDPEVAYGEEFRREKRQETLKKDATIANDTKEASTSNDSDRQANEERRAEGASGPGGVMNSAAQIGGLAAASIVQNDQTYADAKSSSGLASQPLGNPPEHHLKNAGLLRFASSPVVWVIAVLFVIALFAFGILR